MRFVGVCQNCGNEIWTSNDYVGEPYCYKCVPESEKERIMKEAERKHRNALYKLSKRELIETIIELENTIEQLENEINQKE